MTTSIAELQALADELTTVLPPPDYPKGLNSVLPKSGRWAVCRVGAGAVAIRAEYDTEFGVRQVARMDDEITGYPTTVATALRFSIALATSSRHYWIAV